MRKVIISIGFILAAICLIVNMVFRSLGYTNIANVLIVAGCTTYNFHSDNGDYV